MRELREVLEGLLTEDESVRLNVQVLAPIIERAARRAYGAGWLNYNDKVKYSEAFGLECFVAAMMEES